MLYIKEERLKQISLTSHNFAVLIDFDKTMTTMDSDDSWTIIQNPKIMNPKLFIESSKLVDKYYPIEMDYTLSSKEKSSYMYDWYTKELDLYYQYDLTYDKLISCVKKGNVILRDGLKELLYSFYQNNIPVVILSAGIGNVIEEVLRLQGCLYNNITIMSNFFSFEENNLLPFHHDIIHTCNKNIGLLPDDVKQQIDKKDYFLLFGDYIEDIHMVPKEDLRKTLSFGFLEKNVEINFKVYQDAFDVVLTDSSSFYDVKNIINSIIQKAN